MRLPLRKQAFDDPLNDFARVAQAHHGAGQHYYERLTMTSNAHATPPAHPGADADQDARPTIEPKLAQLLAFTKKSQSSLTPKEINATLSSVLQSYDALTAAYANNSRRVEAELAQLRQFGGEVSGLLRQVHADVDQQHGQINALDAKTQSRMQLVHNSVQGQLSDAQQQWNSNLASLKNLFTADISTLDARLNTLNTLMQEQDRIIQEQITRLDQFGVAQELLDTATRGNRSRIETVRELAQSQHAVAKAQIQGLRALQREFYAEFQFVQKSVAELQCETQRLDQAVHRVSSRLTKHTQHTRRQFQWMHGAMVATVLLTAAGFAYFKWSPAFAPASTSAAIADVNAKLGDLDAQVTDLAPLKAATATQHSEMGQLAGQVAELESQLNSLGNTVQNLRAGQTAATLRHNGGLPAHDGAWLLAQNPKAFTVQLLGAPDPSTMARIIAQYSAQLGDNGLAYAVTQRNQRDRYNLFYGLFDTAEQARTALESLPPALRVNKPWVRQMRSVHSALR